MSSISVIGSLILIIYLVLIIMAGRKYASSAESQTDFLVAGRKGKLALVFANFTSSVAAFGIITAQATYANGISAAWLTIFFGLSFVLVGVIVADTFRKLGYFTITEFIGARYGRSPRLLSSVFVILGNIVQIAPPLITAPLIFTSTIGISGKLAVIVGTLVAIGYTYLGGWRGMMVSNGVSSIIAIVVLVIAMFAGISHAGGWSTMAQAVPATHWDLTYVGTPVILGWLLIYVVNSFSASISYQNMASTAGPKVAKQFLVAGGITMMLVGGVCGGLLGIAARASFPNIEPMTAITNMMVQSLGAWGTMVVGLGLFVGALAVTALVLMPTSTIFAHDLYANVVKEANEKQVVGVTKLAIAGIGLLALGVAVIWPGLAVFLAAFGFLLRNAPVFGSVFFGFLWRRGTPEASITSMLAGAGVAIIWQLAGQPFGIQSAYTGIGSALLAFIIVSLITPFRPVDDALFIFKSESPPTQNKAQ